MEAGEILLRRGLLNQRQLEMSRSAQSDGTRLDQVAVDMGFLSEEAALKALGAEVGIDFVDLPDAQVDTAVLASFPQKLIHRQNMFPLRREKFELGEAACHEEDHDLPHLKAIKDAAAKKK